MTDVVERMASEDGSEVLLTFFCPGCKYGHFARIKGAGPIWDWNGSMEKPTFTPSLLVNQHHPESRCHSFVKDGTIQFLGDCWHDLKNQTIPLEHVER